MHVLISVSFSLFSSLISEDDTERRERERRRKEKLEQRGQRGDTQGDQARVDSPGCEQVKIKILSLLERLTEKGAKNLKHKRTQAFCFSLVIIFG